jgi:hypothetical protein
MTFKVEAERAMWACCLALLVAALAACSGLGLGKQDEKVDPNVYPANYKADLVAYLLTHAADENIQNLRDAYVSTPALKQFGTESRYSVCLRADGKDLRMEKMVVFFAGQINQYVDATREQCGAAAYQPFPELGAAFSRIGGKK